MPLFPRLTSLWRNVIQRGRVERQLNEEIGSYVALSIDAKMRGGMREEDARRTALLELGGVEQVKEHVRQARWGYYLETRLQDLRFGLRTLRKSPLFSLTVALVLALGIGSTTLMFTIVNSVLLNGPPYQEADRLFMLWQKLPQEDRVSFSLREFTAWRKQTQVFKSFSSYTGTGFTISGLGEPAFVIGQMVTPSLFQALRAQPALGRVFSEAEGQPGHDQVVILSHAIWREKFGMRADAVGQPVVMNGAPYTVVGVMPETFDFPNREAKLWTPAALGGPLFQEARRAFSACHRATETRRHIAAPPG